MLVDLDWENIRTRAENKDLHLLWEANLQSGVKGQQPCNLAFRDWGIFSARKWPKPELEKLFAHPCREISDQEDDLDQTER